MPPTEKWSLRSLSGLSKLMVKLKGCTIAFDVQVNTLKVCTAGLEELAFVTAAFGMLDLSLLSRGFCNWFV